MKTYLFPLLGFFVLSSLSLIASSGLTGVNGENFLYDYTIAQQLSASIKSQILTDVTNINARIDTIGTSVVGQSVNVTPPGIIAPFAGSAAPAGYLLCNGAVVAISDYQKLYTAIGTTYNTMTNPTTGAAYAAPATGSFRLPDYRGAFIRGVGTSNLSVTSTLGTWQDDATALNGLSASANAVSVSFTSVSTAGAHSHGGVSGANTVNGLIGYVGYGSSASIRPPLVADRADSVYGNGTLTNSTHSHSISADGGHTHTVSGSVSTPSLSFSGDTETRPQNVGVNYVIKY